LGRLADTVRLVIEKKGSYCMIRILSLAAALAAAPTAVHAKAEAPKGEKPAAEKKICKRETATGSIMARVTCRTKAEWDAITAQSQADRDLANDAARSRSLVGQSR
jgi:hypothetical protein